MGAVLGACRRAPRAAEGTCASIDGESGPLGLAEELRKAGNVLCNKGSFADACVQYDEALQKVKEA